MLAAKLVMEQGIEVLGVTFVSEFSSSNLEKFKNAIREMTDEIDLKVQMVDISSEFMTLFVNPYYGFGAHLNPCIDCKILMLKKAKGMMADTGAAFIITGEVLGERPMSQRKDALNSIENKSGLKGYLLRPLSAKLMPPTKAEIAGLVDREKLADIEGRSRKPQFALAKKLNINRHFAPAGGCLLTDPHFSIRLKDIMDKKELTLANARLLKYGRHFRLDDGTKIVLGRDENDNKNILKEMSEGDVFFEPHDFSGPSVLLRGKATPSNMELAAGFLVSYSKEKNKENAKIEFRKPSGESGIIVAKPTERSFIEPRTI
jgi:tRNA U34 2-thiouridine synthase MnmA/TrmU